jgi:hypothetical protein
MHPYSDYDPAQAGYDATYSWSVLVQPRSFIVSPRDGTPSSICTRSPTPTQSCMHDDCRSSPIHQGPVTKIQSTCKIYKLIMEFTAQCHALYSRASVMSPRLSATHYTASSPCYRHGSVPRTVQPCLRTFGTVPAFLQISPLGSVTGPTLR